MNFEYLVKIKREASIDIEDIGNCALDVYNDLGFEWLLLIHTREGLTQIVEFGPLLADMEVPPSTVNYSYERINFSESKLRNKISRFLTDGNKSVTQAFEVTHQEAKEKMKNLVDYICL